MGGEELISGILEHFRGVWEGGLISGIRGILGVCGRGGNHFRHSGAL